MIDSQETILKPGTEVRFRGNYGGIHPMQAYLMNLSMSLLPVPCSSCLNKARTMFVSLINNSEICTSFFSDHES